ncbi:hypothetical protein RhiirA4_481397, partial [Rhizophagus irregularis]
MTNIACQNKAANLNSTNVQDDVNITVQMDDTSLKLVLVNLNLKTNLSEIRKILEQNSKVK